MDKVPGITPKVVESVVSEVADAQDMLWDAVPRRKGENLKAWYVRAADDLTRAAYALGYRRAWTPRRVRAYWNGEVSVFHNREIKTLNQRIESAKAATQAAKERAHGIRMEMGSDRRAVDVGQTHGLRGEVEPDRGMVPRPDEE
jgi:hypothetical protein